MEGLGLAIAAVIFLLGAGTMLYAIVRSRASATTRERLWRGTFGSDGDGENLPAPRSRVMARYRWVPILCGLVLGGVLASAFLWPWPYAGAAGILLAMVGWQLESFLHQQRLQKVEQQLADGIDMMVASVKAGASLQGAIESAMENTPPPWRYELQEVVGRVRYGDAPLEVLGELTERVPLETVRLFAQTLAVNWSVGGRLSQTLASVGRTIRDRIELSRRMHAMTTQGRLSVVSVMATTYFIAALMWRNDPDRMGGFLRSLVGQIMVAGAMILQGIGIVWIARLSTPRF